MCTYIVISVSWNCEFCSTDFEGFFPFLLLLWPILTCQLKSCESTHTHVSFTMLWLIPLKSWGLPVFVKQSMCTRRRSKHLWDCWQELCTTGRRYQALGEGGQTLEQGVKRDCGILIPGNRQPLGQLAVAAPALKGQPPEMPIQQWCDLWVL